MNRATAGFNQHILVKDLGAKVSRTVPPTPMLLARQREAQLASDLMALLLSLTMVITMPSLVITMPSLETRKPLRQAPAWRQQAAGEGPRTSQSRQSGAAVGRVAPSRLSQKPHSTSSWPAGRFHTCIRFMKLKPCQLACPIIFRSVYWL